VPGKPPVDPVTPEPPPAPPAPEPQPATPASDEQAALMETLRARAGRPIPKAVPPDDPPEYIENETSDGPLTIPRRRALQIVRDLNIGRATIDDWKRVANRTKGEVVKFGWVRLTNYGDAGIHPSLTTEGEQRLRDDEDAAGILE
jgi:hypothetical protein